MSISWGAGITGGSGTTSTGLTYKGSWNALTNNPTLVSGVGTENNYYIVTTGGNTNLDGTTVWSATDWAIFSGGAWRRIGGGILVVEQLAVTALNTVANLTFTPKNVNQVLFFVNRTVVTPLDGMTVAGVVITVTPATLGYDLATTDTVIAYYQR